MKLSAEEIKRRHNKCQKSYYQSHKEQYKIYKYNYPRKVTTHSKTLFWDVCPICNIRGRFRLVYIKNNRTDKKSSEHIQVMHLVSNNHNKYSHSCYIGMLKNLKNWNEKSFLENKESIIKEVRRMVLKDGKMQSVQA